MLRLNSVLLGDSFCSSRARDIAGTRVRLEKVLILFYAYIILSYGKLGKERDDLARVGEKMKRNGKWEERRKARTKFKTTSLDPIAKDKCRVVRS